MPFASERQRRFMFSQHPDIANRWAREGKAYVAGSDHRAAIQRRLSGRSKSTDKSHKKA